MNVLQIAIGVTASKVYSKLFSELKKQHIPFMVYVPLHGNNNTKDINEIDFPFYYYSNEIIKPYDKLIYFTKIRRMVKDVELNFNLSEVSLVHAHSLFSDGAVAYELYKKYDIPYIIAVRNYDVNKYFKYAFHLRKYALEIILNAKKVIFISPSYQKHVIDKYIPNKFREKILLNTKIIPNGVDDYWLKQTLVEKTIDKKLKLIFVGRIDNNKNLAAVIQVVDLLRKKGMDCTLDVVGDGPLREAHENECRGVENIVFHGAIYDKDKIREIYINSNILVVPSFTETFGLVYLEAMSCGVPVIYTQNQGFDGQFEEGEVGFHVNPNDKEDIVRKIIDIRKDYINISQNCLRSTKKFHWEKIAREYINFYED
ncbi:glycosyltransferase family 4 protein [Paraliobacillus zengyii]|uniref:glycosyltransferase family 4 protein n=1 Tax=Paraliobacillus zengyii TaxID=2213194 RepID=UPI000E3D880E|nr:glycosyltransferase family 4 protein [Paraliobacillus zengyii]